MYRNKKKLSLTELTATQNASEKLNVPPLESEKNIITIKKGQLCLPKDWTNISFVQKQGKKTHIELKIYQLIASNEQSKEQTILQPVLNASNELSLCLPLMVGGDLEFHHNFLATQFEKKP